MKINEEQHIAAPQGLTDNEVIRSREKYGNNMLTPTPPTPLWKLFAEKFDDPVIRILLVAALISLGIAFVEHDFAETIGIFCAIFLATGIGFLFEYDAQKKFNILNAVNEETLFTVIRNGMICRVSRKDIVVGDVVILETGEEVPADGLLLKAISLQVNESTLTGEPVVDKTTQPDLMDAEATYPSNELLRGTTVVNGRAMLQITRVGDATEYGKVAHDIQQQSEIETPLNKQLNRLANLIGKAGFTVAILSFLIFSIKDIYLLSLQHNLLDWTQALPVFEILLKYFMVAVTLIVVAVPEGLPMSITLSLALNMRRMLKTNNLVRKMHACETMGAITVICTDKTGTLTQNRMQVQEAWIAEESSAELANCISINSTAHLDTQDALHSGIGNPTEIALLQWLMAQGTNYLPIRQNALITSQLTFSTERKYMATLVASNNDSNILYVKGAPEVVLSFCSLTDAKKQELQKTLLAYQSRAMRTLAMAYVPINQDATTDCRQLIDKYPLTLLGIVGISDPIRTDVPAAINQCIEAGIKVKVVTGDTSATAIEIARQIGLWEVNDRKDIHHITGTDFALLSDEEALKRIADIKIISRARPADKQRFVQLLQRAGEVVAVTGDGTNDAPALNLAHVGLSMGSGTAVAKEASDITLLDDSFHSIATAVLWGRSLYKNIQRFITFQLTVNVVALGSVLLGAILGCELPLTVTQMLWVNLIMDTFAAMALASLPPSKDVMKEKPRSQDAFIITRAMYQHIFGVGSVLLAVLMCALWIMNRNLHISLHELTLFFTFFVLLQFWNLFNASTMGTHHSVFTQLSKSKGLLVVAVLILSGQFCIVQWGNEVFRTTPLSITHWLVLLAVSSLVLVAGEIYRWHKRLQHRIKVPGYAAAIGFFDGVHKGHQFLINQVKQEAEVRGMQSAVITFSVHPRQVVQTDYVPSLLSSPEEKNDLLSQTGVHRCITLPFTRELSQYSAYQFMQLLHDEYNVRCLIIGYDHRFGHNRSEGFADYCRYGKELGIELIQAQEYGENEQHISSSTIRKLLLNGNLEQATALMGHAFSLSGTVVHGHHVGQKIGFPTANLQLSCPHKLIPANGVYAVKVRVLNQEWKGMLNIGYRPTLRNGEERSIEVHILDFDADIYGHALSMEIISYIRKEQKFDSITQLINQLHKDKENIYKLLS